MRFVDVFNPAMRLPWERHSFESKHQLWPHVVYRYPTELGRATHLEAERAALKVVR